MGTAVVGRHLDGVAADHGRHASQGGASLAVTAAVVAIGVVLTGAGVYATLKATANNAAPQVASTGTLTLALTNNGVGFGTPIAGMAPGDVVRRQIQLTNSGTLAGTGLTLGVVDATPSTLSTNAVTGLQVVISQCTVAWTPATGLCSGTTTVLVTTNVNALRTTPASLIPGALAIGSVTQLQVQVTLPDSVETSVNGVLPAGTVQGLSAALTWTFVETQRLSTSSSS